MNQELTQRLVKRFPILYQNYSSPMTHTCMCWGFEHGDGWFEIIWQLSLAIEAELNYSWHRKRWFLFKKWFFRHWNDFLTNYSKRASTVPLATLATHAKSETVIDHPTRESLTQKRK